ncbi:hypothetical protein CH063_16128, partial [Colletotrichum higginsianum]
PGWHTDPAVTPTSGSGAYPGPLAVAVDAAVVAAPASAVAQSAPAAADDTSLSLVARSDRAPR